MTFSAWILNASSITSSFTIEHESLRYVECFTIFSSTEICPLTPEFEKIDKYHVSLLASEESLLRLSEGEQRYAKNYKKILNRHMMDSFLKDIPQGLRGTEDVRSDVNMGM